LRVAPARDTLLARKRRKARRLPRRHHPKKASMKRMIAQLTIALALLCLAPTPHANASADPFLGEITIFTGSFAPRGWVFCEGQMMAIAQNTALFSIVGTSYGGDGKTTFKLPDLRDAEAKLRKDDTTPGPRYIIALQGIYPSRGD